MPRKIKPVVTTCIYCRKEITFPGEGAEMSKTRRGDTWYFHTLCFVRNRKECNRWM